MKFPPEDLREFTPLAPAQPVPNLSSAQQVCQILASKIRIFYLCSYYKGTRVQERLTGSFTGTFERPTGTFERPTGTFERPTGTFERPTGSPRERPSGSGRHGGRPRPTGTGGAPPEAPSTIVDLDVEDTESTLTSDRL
jgi:hypothetical protein